MVPDCDPWGPPGSLPAREFLQVQLEAGPSVGFPQQPPLNKHVFSLSPFNSLELFSHLFSHGGYGGKKAHLFPERRSCGKSMQLKLVTLQVEQGQVETLNLDQHLKKCQKWFQISSGKKEYKEPNLLVIRSCPLGLCSWCRTAALRDGALRASNLK